VSEHAGGTAAGEREAGVAKRGKDDMIYVGLFGEQQREDGKASNQISRKEASLRVCFGLSGGFVMRCSG
jgi:hypothetical protein